MVITNWEKAKWENEKLIKSTLKYHPKDSCIGSEKFIWETSKRSKIMCKLRLGDIIGKAGSSRNECLACGQINLRDLRKHIILVCPSLTVSRLRIEIDQTHNPLEQDDERRVRMVKEILDNTSIRNLVNLRALYKKWLEAY